MDNEEISNWLEIQKEKREFESKHQVPFLVLDLFPESEKRRYVGKNESKRFA